MDPYNALLADLFPPARRGAVNGLAALVQLVGIVLALLGAAALAARGRLPLAFGLVAATLLVATALTAVVVLGPA